MTDPVAPRFGPATFDLWVFYRKVGETRYLMMRTSQEKADKWFGGGRFWQIPGDFYKENEAVVDAIRRSMKDDLHLEPTAAWACEYVYTIYNRRFDSLQIIPVFAAEVAGPRQVPLTWEHSEAGWFTARECLDRIRFWGLKEGLVRTREYVTENPKPSAEFQLF